METTKQAKSQAKTDWRKAIKSQLLRLSSPKQMDTVTAIIERRILGQSWDTEEFWQRPDTCARATFNKWKKYDPDFTNILDAAWGIAREYRAESAAAAIDEAVLTLQLSTPLFVERVIKIAKSHDETIALRAAFGGLDRASSLTATKSEMSIPPEIGHMIEKIYGLPEPGDGEPDAAASEEE